MTMDARLAVTGRIFYGVAIAAIGLLTIYYRDVPYFLLPPDHSWLNGHLLSVFLAGVLLLLAGGSIAFGWKVLRVSLLLGTILLLIFCFYFIPYELLVATNYRHFGAWENAAKTLALAGGAFVIAARDSTPVKNPLMGALKKLIPVGSLCYPLTIISFSIDHFLYAKEAAGYVPSWIPNPVFWLYFTGSALFASGVAIVLKILPRLAAGLLGTMILIWVLILHIPKVVAAPITDWGEQSSAFLALAYCGIAFVISGAAILQSRLGAEKPIPEPGF
jgi:hypothetical protein